MESNPCESGERGGSKCVRRAAAGVCRAGQRRVCKSASGVPLNLVRRRATRSRLTTRHNWISLLPSRRLVLARCRACLTAFLRSRERQKTARLRAAEAVWGKLRRTSCRSSVGCSSLKGWWPKAGGSARAESGASHRSLLHVRAHGSDYSRHGPTVARLRKEYMLSLSASGRRSACRNAHQWELCSNAAEPPGSCAICSSSTPLARLSLRPRSLSTPEKTSL